MKATKFCQQFYLESGGWIPMTPLTQSIKLGDFCQIRHAMLRPLGNVQNLRLVEDVQINELKLTLNESEWRLSSGVGSESSSMYQESDNDSERQWTRQLLDFAQTGDFVFHGDQPNHRLITNWSNFQDDITIKLTQSSFSFRQLYVITEIISFEDWVLAIAARTNAQLEIVAELSDADYFSLISHSSCFAERSLGMTTFQKSVDKSAHFFKAKKLVLSDLKREEFLGEILEADNNLSAQEQANWLDVDMINRVESNELNIATCMDYFNWVDTSLDDAVLLC